MVKVSLEMSQVQDWLVRSYQTIFVLIFFVEHFSTPYAAADLFTADMRKNSTGINL